MEKHEVILDLVKNGELCSRVYCTARAAKYLMIGFGLEPRPFSGWNKPPHPAPDSSGLFEDVKPPVSDTVELLPDGDVRKVTKRSSK